MHQKIRNRSGTERTRTAGRRAFADRNDIAVLKAEYRDNIKRLEEEMEEQSGPKPRQQIAGQSRIDAIEEELDGINRRLAELDESAQGCPIPLRGFPSASCALCHGVREEAEINRLQWSEIARIGVFQLMSHRSNLETLKKNSGPWINFDRVGRRKKYEEKERLRSKRHIGL